MEVETAGTQLPKEPKISSHTQKKDQPDNKDVYTVEKVLDKKVENGQKLYLIKWEGYPTSQSTWEPVENLLSVIDIIVEYEVRECTRQEEKEHAKGDESPKNHSKRKADRSLSEEDVVKKVKGDSSEAKEKTSRKESHEEDDDEEDDEDDDDDDEKETMQEKLNRRKKHLSRLKAFQGKEFTDQETLAKVSKNINMAHPFVIETVKDEDLEGSDSEEEEDDLSDAPKRKRGRPRKIRTERGDGIVRKRGRPRKIRPEGVEGEAQGPKRGPGRPRKHPIEEEEGKEAKQEAPRKRGRPRKNPTMEEKEDEEGEDVKEGDDTAKEPKQEAGENNEVAAVAAPKKRGRPRKEVHYQEIEESEGSDEEDEHAGDKEPKPEKKQEGDKMETEEKEGEEKGEIGEEKETEGASPTAFLKARKEAVLKRRGLSLEEGKVSAEGVVKRGRGRPRKNRDVEPTSATIAEGEEDKEKEKSELKKENEEEETKEKEGLENEEDGEEHDEGEEGSEEEEEEDDKQKSQPARKRGRPRKNQPRKRGRPRKEVRVTREEEEENASKEQNVEEESAPAAPRKRGRPRKIVTDVNKENDYQSGYGKGDQEDQAGVNSSILGVRSGQSTEGESQQKKQSASAHKFGSLNEKDIPKRIIKARVVTDKGCIFLIEWEKRPSGEQPQNSHVTSHELKNFDPSFLLEYYEEIVKKNLKNKAAPPKEEVAPRDEDMIPLEQNPELFGSFAFHDNPKEIIKVNSADQEGWEFLVRWEPRNNNIQPLDSVVNNEALKLHDPNFLISYYESKIRAKPGEEAVITLDILDPTDEKETEQGESEKNAEVPAGEAGVNSTVTEAAMQQEPVAQD